MVIKTKMAFVLAISLSFAACNKTCPPPTVNYNTEDKDITSSEIKQKLYSLTSKECNTVIKSFKEFTREMSMQSKIESSTIAADSSIWLLAAALNYDFDKQPNSNITSVDSCGYKVSNSNNSVSSSEFINAYTYFFNHINQKITSQNKVKVIDISAYNSGAKIIYTASIVFFTDLNSQKIASPCDPYTTETAKWSTTYWSSSLCGTGSTSNDGPTLVEAKLNCTAYDPGCGSWYWTSITTVGLGNVNGAYSPNLFYVGSTMTPCNIFNASQLNTYISNCQAYGVSYLPGSNYILINYDVKPGVIWLGGFSYKIWWDLDIKYGIPQCNGGGGNG